MSAPRGHQSIYRPMPPVRRRLHLAEGIRAELLIRQSKVSNDFPRLYSHELNEGAKNYHLKWMKTGYKALVKGLKGTREGM